MKKQIHIFGGGTLQHVRSHLALCAPAYGNTARLLAQAFEESRPGQVGLHLTKMADPASNMVTNDDVAARVAKVLDDERTTAIIFNVALCDFSGQIADEPSGKYASRLKSRNGEEVMHLTPVPKLLSAIKVIRPDITLVGFKTTAGASLEEQRDLAWAQIKESKADYVFANDTVTRVNQLARAVGATERAAREVLLAKLVSSLEGLL
ncbi:uncharacterized protein NMK_2079 [Novimethylophilus kurashikiensis]|uniref:DNA/pantothenate metabolism flavoprotein C-terminal domain-containing protein n=1 Tax=Novimethylophilus kurashikiensis TaxID=1825523 RepID=A0A2R5F8A5_9PROT|nr:hypothetical protein [Novimethylophilus kurashikiensis]GBG14480.1 uncharacterized protein NMK_2079 [Novimethylophilus kurashikiensis]